MGFEEDFGGVDYTEEETQQPTNSETSNKDGGSSGSGYNPKDRFAVAYYKPKRNFDPQDSKTIGCAFQAELAQYDKYNSVFIAMARQIGQQTRQRGARIFDWSGDQVVKFKCGITDIQHILTVLSYLEPSVSLIHKTDSNTSTFSATIMGSIKSDPIARLCKQFVEGDSKNEPRTSGINPKSINITIKRNNVDFKIMLLPFEALGLKIYLEESLKRMYGKPYQKD